MFRKLVLAVFLVSLTGFVGCSKEEKKSSPPSPPAVIAPKVIVEPFPEENAAKKKAEADARDAAAFRAMEKAKKEKAILDIAVEEELNRLRKEEAIKKVKDDELLAEATKKAEERLRPEYERKLKEALEKAAEEREKKKPALPPPPPKKPPEVKKGLVSEEWGHYHHIEKTEFEAYCNVQRGKFYALQAREMSKKDGELKAYCFYGEHKEVARNVWSSSLVMKPGYDEHYKNELARFAEFQKERRLAFEAALLRNKAFFEKKLLKEDIPKK